MSARPTGGEIQRLLADADWRGLDLRVRMAVDVREVEARGGDYFGPVMNRAGRMLAAAHGGQVLLSADAHAALSTSRAAGRRRPSASFGSRASAAHSTSSNSCSTGSPRTSRRSDRRAIPPIPVGAFGRSVRGYELRERVGSGDVGVVYRAYQPSVGREVAIKVIAPSWSTSPRSCAGSSRRRDSSRSSSTASRAAVRLLAGSRRARTS